MVHRREQRSFFFQFSFQLRQSLVRLVPQVLHLMLREPDVLEERLHQLPLEIHHGALDFLELRALVQLLRGVREVAQAAVQRVKIADQPAEILLHAVLRFQQGFPHCEHFLDIVVVKLNPIAAHCASPPLIICDLPSSCSC